MIKDALEFLAKIQTPRQPQSVEINGAHYAVAADGTLGDPVVPPVPPFDKPAFSVSTLSGLVGLYKNKVDSFPQKTAVHIVDPLTVKIVALEADEFGRRHVYAIATHVPDTAFQFNKYMEPEPFLIAFRASFLFNEDAVKVQQLCSTVGSGDAVIVSDDGISQEVQIKSGTVTRSAVALPADGVPLIALRSFREPTPVVSKFLLRMKGVKDALPHIALFEIDSKWKLDTIASIQKWLVAELPPEAVIIA